MSLPYPTISDNSGSLNSGSYFGGSEYELFNRGLAGDLWFGNSEYDHIEVSAYDLADNLLKWDKFYTEKTFRDVTLTFVNEKEEPIEYTYKVLENNFLRYKNSKLLVDPISDITSFDLSEGGYKLTYNMIRTMAGTRENPLSVKEISPSRKEIKLIPTDQYDNRFVAFALGKFQIKDVSPLIITRTKQCPYSEIYNKIKGQYKEAIDFLKYIFAIQTDDGVVNLLKNTYEDYIRYTSLSTQTLGLGFEPSQVIRKQGIRTYFHNFLLSGKENVSSFPEIRDQYNKYVLEAVARQFERYEGQMGENYAKSKQFVYDFFTKYFYNPNIDPLEVSYNEKYESYFSNALNLGNDRFIPFLNHSYVDERKSEGDPLTITIKLAEELPNDIGTKTSCWVTNVRMVPLVFNVLYKIEQEIPTIRISPADFTLPINNASLEYNNKLYSTEDLAYASFDEENEVILNKKLSELDIDYTKFSNFINFSSAQVRLTVFKNKMIEKAGLDNALNDLDTQYSASVLAGGTYPNYLTERENVTDQIQTIINGFDGYETYLYKTGHYTYSLITKTFKNSDFVTTLDNEALYFDKENANSLINNTPEHVRLDSQNDDYIIFISMMGHYFDNIYNYILCLPAQRQLQNETSSSFNKMVTEQMLNVYGWKTEDDSDLASLAEYYSTGSLNSGTDENRMRAIWNRVLNNLPLIYKNKGTQECINILLSCYGIPSEYLTIKEYGGVDYSEDSKVTYTKDEKRWLTHTKTTGIAWFGNTLPYSPSYIQGPWTNNIKTIEFKMSTNRDRDVGIRGGYGQYFYTIGSELPIFQARQQYATDRWTAVWYYGASVVDRWIYTASTSSAFQSTFEIGIKRERGENMGRAYFRMHGGLFIEHTGSATTSSTKVGTGPGPTGSYTGSIPAVGFPTVTQSRSGAYMETDPIPILDGEIYNIMLRRNVPYWQFESSSVSALENNIPTQYDLVVQRNVDGRVAVKASSSIVLNEDNNYGWTRPGDWLWGTNNVYGFQGYIDRLNFWDIPLPDDDFEDHVNNYDSYAYSGSEAYKHLWLRYAPEYPYDFTEGGVITDYPWNTLSTLAWGFNTPNQSWYYTGRKTYLDVYATSGTGISSSVSHSRVTQSREYYDNYWDSRLNQYNTYGQRLSNYPITTWQFIPEYTTASYDTNSCVATTSSAYPYTFVQFNVPITYTTPKYGPNKFKNEKIKKKAQSLEARLDPSSTSTRFGNETVSPDSNQIGFFADPQRWRNSDIINYFGDINVIDELAIPSSLESDRYDTLAIKRNQYRNSSLNNVFFNEMNTIYKLYFDRSLFEIIRRLIPARSDALTGFLVEPGILERPKYKHQPITTSLTEFTYTSNLKAEISNSVIVEEFLLWGQTNEPSESLNETLRNSLPSSYKDTIDMTYVSDPNRNFPVNYGGNYVRARDILQFGQIGETDNLGRVGVTYQMDLDKDTKTSGSVYFLVKRWRKYNIYTRNLSSSLYRSEFVDMNVYDTASVWLYDLMAVTSKFMNELAYTHSALAADRTGVLPADPGPPARYLHNINTFKNTPNEPVSNITAGPTDPVYTYKIIQKQLDESSPVYYEIFNGYPRNHYTHKTTQFSPEKFPTTVGVSSTGSIYVRGRNSVDTTVGTDGIPNGSYPVISIDVGNVNIVKSDSVLEV